MSAAHYVKAWLDDRLGRNAPSGRETACGLGAVALVILVVTALSGVWLAMFFHASPAEAWKSVMFIERKVALGSFARALHGWGALLLIVCVLMHLVSVICRGAYRAPRELNWLVGIALLLLMCAFVITGYMLPWDFRSYWIVQTVINWLEQLPLFSGLLEWLIRADSANDLVPVGRWFAIHICVLPLLTGVFLALHLMLFRRHGSAQPEK